MKHKFENGKWKPENGTFVKVPNEQIPEVIQMLRENGQKVWENQDVWHTDKVVHFLTDSWNSTADPMAGAAELPFPDFKALVTGKLPESFCIQCTEESMKHPAWEIMVISAARGANIKKQHERSFILFNHPGLWMRKEPFGEVLQIETWAAVDEMSKNSGIDYAQDGMDSMTYIIHNQKIQPKPTDDEAIQTMINELKSLGYTISKIY